MTNPACDFKFVGVAHGDENGEMWCCLRCGNVIVVSPSSLIFDGTHPPYSRACSGIFGKDAIEMRDQLDAIHAILAPHYCDHDWETT